MSEPIWHLERAKVVLDMWYRKKDEFLESALQWQKLLFCSTQVGDCKRLALKCKTLGLVFHDQHKLLMDKCWRKR